MDEMSVKDFIDDTQKELAFNPRRIIVPMDKQVQLSVRLLGDQEFPERNIAAGLFLDDSGKFRGRSAHLTHDLAKVLIMDTERLAKVSLDYLIVPKIFFQFHGCDYNSPGIIMQAFFHSF